MPWFNPHDSRKVRKKRAREHRDGRRFAFGVPLLAATAPEPALGAGGVPVTDWPWGLAESWYLFAADGRTHPDLLPSSVLSPSLFDTLARWQCCLPPTPALIHNATLPLVSDALTRLAQVAASHPTRLRRCAALFMFQVFPRLVLCCPPPGSSRAALARSFLAGNWRDLAHSHLVQAIQWAGEHAQRINCIDCDAPTLAPMSFPTDAHCTPVSSSLPLIAPFERTMRLVKQGKLRSAVQALTSGDACPYGSCTLTLLTDLQFQPVSVDSLATLRDEAVEFCTGAVQDLLCLDPGPTLDDNGWDISDGPAIEQCMRTARRNSARGPSGHYLDYLRDIALQPGASGFLLLPLVTLIAFIANGGLVVDHSTAVITGATAMALLKGATLADKGIRPLAIGEPLRRLVGAAILSKLTQENNNVVAAALLPHQFGVGLRSGVDLMFNIIRLMLALHPDWLCFGTDVGSAFCKMPRHHFLSVLKSHPTLSPVFPFAATCYLFPSPCFYGELFSYLSEEGSAQGCCLGSLTFAVGLDPILKAVAKDHLTVIILAYCDDIWLCGPPADTIKALVALDSSLRTLSVRGSCLSFSFDEGKTWAFSEGPNTLSALDPKVFPTGTKLIPPSAGLKGLGCFYGNPAWLSAAVVEHFASKHSPLHAQLRALAEYGRGPCAQCAALLNSFCASTRLTHIARLVAPADALAAITAHQSRTMLTLSHILGGDALCLAPEPHSAVGVSGATLFAALTPVHRQSISFARQQASLPINLGGMGLTPLHLTFPTAFLASWITTTRFLVDSGIRFPAFKVLASCLTSELGLPHPSLRPAAEMRVAWNTLSSFLGGSDRALCKSLRIPDFASLATSPRATPQHALSIVVSNHHFGNLKLCAPGTDDRVRLISASGPGAGAFLEARPSDPGLLMDNFSFRVACFLRLGLPLPCLRGCESSLCDSNKCFDVPDPFGHHIMRCNLSSKFARHQSVLRCLDFVCKRAGLKCQISSCDRIDNELRELLGQKQADLIMPDFRGLGLDAHLDVFVVHPLLRMYGDIEYALPGDAIKLIKHPLKQAHYASFTARGHVFQGFGVESFGCIDSDALRFVNDFVTRAFVVGRGVKPDTKRGELLGARFTRQFLCRLSVSIQLANAALVKAAVIRRNPSEHATLCGLVALSAPAPVARTPKRRKRKRSHVPRRPLATAPPVP